MILYEWFQIALFAYFNLLPHPKWLWRKNIWTHWNQCHLVPPTKPLQEPLWLNEESLWLSMKMETPLAKQKNNSHDLANGYHYIKTATHENVKSKRTGLGVRITFKWHVANRSALIPMKPLRLKPTSFDRHKTRTHRLISISMKKTEPNGPVLLPHFLLN